MAENSGALIVGGLFMALLFFGGQAADKDPVVEYGTDLDAETYAREPTDEFGIEPDEGDSDESETLLFAPETRGGETYSEFDERRDELGESRGTYMGYGCTVNCDGHEAGYRWAEERGIENEWECGGKSWSFEEGCRSYAEEHEKEREAESDTFSDD